MNMTQALAKLRKLLGPKAAIRDDRTPSSPEVREQQRAARNAAHAHRKACEAAMNARRDAVLAADAEFQRLRAEYDAAKAAADRCPYPAYRYTGGTASALFFSVEAQADTLAELVEAVERKRAPADER
jgi:hypothetical protein